MREYISGYYCRDDLHLQIINKDSNRRILQALRNAYPNGLTVEELAKKTKLPMKTVYAQKAELFREYYVNHFEEQVDKAKRGRPSTLFRERSSKESLRKRVKIVIEETSGLFDPYKGKKPTPLPPGIVAYADGFPEVWQEIVGEEEVEQLYEYLLRFIQRVFNRSDQLSIKENSNWIPSRTIDFCCTQCGLNHEARDFVRAILLHLIDNFERYDKFIELLKDNQMLTQEGYEEIRSRNPSVT